MRIGRLHFPSGPAPAVGHRGMWVRAAACDGVDPAMDVTDLLGLGPGLGAELARLDLETLAGSGHAVLEESAALLAPLVGPRAIVAVGLNYREHAAEVTWEAPPTPLLFAKWPSALADPYAPVSVDRSLTMKVDFEVELAAVIGRPTLDVAVDEALDHVAGYAVANDISARDIQHSESQWTRAKSFNGFCPIGPWVTTADEIPDPQALKLSCSVNGEVRQSSSTAHMVHGVADLVAFASRAMTLNPGDIILTGTPSGVAMGESEPRWLMAGDVVRSEIEGLGYLQNQIVDRVGAR